MHDRAVRPKGRDRVEADVLELARLTPESFELERGRDLIDLAGRAHLVEPGEEARHGDAVAKMRRPRAFDLRFVLDRLGRDAGIGTGRELAALGLERAREADCRRLGIEPQPRAGAAERF